MTNGGRGCLCTRRSGAHVSAVDSTRLAAHVGNRHRWADDIIERRLPNLPSCPRARSRKWQPTSTFRSRRSAAGPLTRPTTRSCRWDGAGWLAFLRSLTAGGMSGVPLVIFDAHRRLVNAIAACLPGAS